MRHSAGWRVLFIVGVFLLVLAGGAQGAAQSPEAAVRELPLLERSFCASDDRIDIGIANIGSRVTPGSADGIEYNKRRMLRIIDRFKEQGVNMIVFPEFCLTGYLWHDPEACRPYMEAGLMGSHTEWLAEVKARLDDTLRYIVINGLRTDPADPGGRYRNSVFVVSEGFDCADLDAASNEEAHIYDKTFIPGIEKDYEVTGQDDALVLETDWGTFGVATCYDMCFPELIREYATVHRVDAVLEVAGWRGSGRRDYPGANINRESYYGYIWNLMAASQAAFNQVWVIASNAVGHQEPGDYTFWGGSGFWAPSGLRLFHCSNSREELLVVENLDIRGEVRFEHDDFYYFDDFREVYSPVEGKRTFTRTED